MATLPQWWLFAVVFGYAVSDKQGNPQDARLSPRG